MDCVRCGSKNPEGARFCLSCGSALSASAAGPAAILAGRRVARLGARFIAVILDTLLLAAVFAAIGMWIAVRFGGITAGGFEMTGAPVLLTLGIVGAVAFLYYWLFEAFFGATLGKAIVGVFVCGADGRRCGMMRSLIRNVLRLVDGFAVYLVGFLVAVFSKQRQRLGDHLAGTYVVAHGVGKVWRALLALVWLAAIAAGIAGAVVIHRRTPAGSVGVSLTPTDATGVAGTPTRAPAPSPAAILMSGDLKLSDFAILESEGGAPRPARPLKPRERLFATFKVTGLTTDAQGQVHLRYGVEAFDANGLLMQKVSQELNGAPGPSNTATISVWFDIPLYVPPGAAKMRVMAHDNVKNTDGEIVAPFVVDAPPLVASSRLEIRDLHFALSEDGPALDPPVVQAGTTLYVQGQLAGMQFRDDEIDVGIAFQVQDPQGDKVLDKPDFLVVKDSFAYHPPTFYIPITAHLSLPSGALKGTYREKYILTDRIGDATRTYDLTFRLE